MVSPAANVISPLHRLRSSWKRRGEAPGGADRADWFDRLALGCSAGRAALLAWGLSTFVASPAFFGWTWEGITQRSRAADFLKLCAWPFARDLAEPVVAYRITVPLVAWVFQLPPVLALLLPYVAHVAFLAVTFIAISRRADRPTALLGTLMMALSYALFWSNWHPGFTDTVTHFAVGCLLLTTAGKWVAPLVLLGTLNDERMVLALPLVMGWHLLPGERRLSLRGVGGLLSGMLLGLGAYALVRHSLAVGWVGPGIAEPPTYAAMRERSTSLQPHLGSWAVWLLNVFLSFRWAWLLVPPAIGILGRRAGWPLAAGITACLLVGVLASALVADVARSVGFLFPMWLIAVAVLYAESPARSARFLRWIVVALLATPVFFTFEDFHVHWFRPLPLVLARWLGGFDPLQLLGL